MEKFIEKYNVSRETYQKLEQYVQLLKEWQAKFNLVSQNSLSDVWNRHIEDSAQLFKFVDDNIKTIYDFGSGAGFPALVLAIIAQEKRPEIKFTLIESTAKKTLYLNAVKAALNLHNVRILTARVENARLPQADMITARALTSLDNLLGYAKPFCSSRTKLLFPKGRTYLQDVEDAEKKWLFSKKVYPNDLSEGGVVLLLENLRRKK